MSTLERNVDEVLLTQLEWKREDTGDALYSWNVGCFKHRIDKDFFDEDAYSKATTFFEQHLADNHASYVLETGNYCWCNPAEDESLGPDGSTHWEQCRSVQRFRPTEDPFGTCDWGNCDNEVSDWRLSPTHGWLPVCFVHSEPRTQIIRTVGHDFEGPSYAGPCAKCGNLRELHPLQLCTCGVGEFGVAYHRDGCAWKAGEA